MSTGALTFAATAGEPPGDGVRVDAALLHAYLASRDATAFEAMVRRHGPMVLGVCLRILRHREDAEDAFQAVFIVLARKAGAIRPEKLAGWLYSVAHRTAMKARTMRQRRQEREAMCQTPAQSGYGHDPEWSDLAPILDEELMRLPEQQRLPLILNMLRGQSKSQVATTLGLAEGTVSSRLARAREALRARLLRRGISISAAALATAMAANAAASVPDALIVQTTQTAVGSAAAPAGIAALSKGVLHAMFMHKLQVVAGWMLAIAVVAAGGGMMVYSAVAKDAAPAKKAAVDGGVLVRGGVVALQGDQLTVGTMEDGNKAQRTVILVGDGNILLQADGKSDKATPGKREDLTPGTNVTITLAADGQTAQRIVVAGRATRGTIQAVDGKTIKLTAKGKDAAQDVEIKVDDATKVILATGKDKGDVLHGTVADLRPGMQVSISLSAAEKDLARSITVQPRPETPKGAKDAK